jgi:PAS domain S-box-containing protein
MAEAATKSSGSNGAHDVARGDHQAVPPLSSSSQTGHFIKWKRAERHTALLNEAGYVLLGVVSLATVTGLYFWLGVPLVAAAFTYLVVLVLLSLVSNFSSLIVLSLIGVCCLNYFFAPPIFSFRVDYAQDLITMSAFVITSFIVNFLVTRVRVEQRDHIRTQETLRESERRARSAFDGIAGLVSILAPNGKVEAVNRQVLDYFGRSQEWLTNWGTNDAVHPEDLPRILELFKRAMASGVPFNFELRMRRFDGEYRWFDNRGVPIRDDSGRIVRWYVLLLDIEDRKRAEHALRSALDGIAGLVVILGPNGEVETVNRQVFEYFGRSLEEVKNWATNDALHPEDLPRVVEIFARAVTSGIPFNFDHRLRRFDGEYLWFDTRGLPIRDDSGRIARWYVLLTDIEDRTRALARLEQMQSDLAHMNRVSMIGELTASLSHEITQPIASARNNARAAQNFLDMQPPDLSEAREALSCVVSDTDRAGDIVDRIRDHIKKAPPRKEHFDLNEAIDEVIVLGRSAVIKNGVSVQTRLSEGLFPVHGDRVQLQQVVLNLVLNAVEAMGSTEAGTRELLISTDQDHRGVLVAVRDSGPGIDPSHLERVFDTFYTTKSSGMGMGLSICRSIIDAHGGRLWAEANEPRGTIFQFTLPAVQVGA